MALTSFAEATRQVFHLALVISYLTQTNHAANILMLPLTGTAHTIYFEQLGQVLIQNGHQVHAVVNGDCESINQLHKANINIITYNNTLGGCIMESPQIKFTVKMALEFNKMSWMEVYDAFSGIGPLLRTEVWALLSNDKLFRRLRKMNFDLIVVDGIVFNRYAYVLAYRLQKPFVSLQAVFNPFEAGIPALPSIYPSKTSELGKHLVFRERLQNVISTCFDIYILPWLISRSMGSLVSEYAPEMPYTTISSIARQSKLWLVLNDDIIDFPTITAPNVVQVGGLITKPAQPLTGKLKEVADGAEDGLIVVSFGNDISLPPRVNKLILLALGQIKQTVIMKSSGEQIKGLAKNIHQHSWIPQNDLLGHPNTRLFITHCGSKSQFEALYHAVPMIGMPFFGDQMHNAYRIIHHGMGKIINHRDFTSKELLEIVNDVLTNGTCRDNCKLKSDIFRNRPMSAMQRAIYWIEYVIKYGGEDLRPAGIDLGFLEYWCVDLAIIGIVLTVVLLYMFTKIAKCIIFSCCRRRQAIPIDPRPKTD